MSILEVNHIKKVYKTRMGGDEVTALRDVHFSVEPGTSLQALIHRPPEKCWWMEKISPH